RTILTRRDVIMAHVSFPVDENRWPRALGKLPNNSVVWNATDGLSSTTKWRIIVGSFAGGSDCYLGTWQNLNGGLIFPRFCGHRVTRQPPLLRTRRGTDSHGSSGVAADYKILRGIQRFPAWRPPATDTGGDGLIPASTCQRSSRHTRCPSSFLDVTCFRSCLQPAVVAGRPWLHTDSHDPNGGAGLVSVDGGGAPSLMPAGSTLP